MQPELTGHTSLTYADRPITKLPDWHGLVVADLVFNNFATGLFLCCAAGELLRPAGFSPLATVAYPVALLCLMADLILLVLDLGDPSRFHHMLRVWKPSSPMSLGTWSLSAFAVPLTILSGLGFLGGRFPALEWLRLPMILLGLVPALASAMYKGVLFTTTAQPGWREARWLGGYLANSAIVFGAALLLAIALVVQAPEATQTLRWSLIALLPVHLALLGLLLTGVGPRLCQVRTPGQLTLLGAVVVLGGVLLPVGLLVVGSPVAEGCALALLLAGAVMARWELVYLPHRIPAGKTG